MSNKLKVVVSRDLGPDVMPLLTNNPELDVIVWPHDSACDRNWLLENVQGASGILVMLSDKVNAELFDAAGPSLRVVSTMSVGYEHADLAELSKRGIRFGYTPDVLTDAVADLSVMLALMAGRNAKETTEVVQTGQWPNFVWSPFGFCGPQLSATPISPSRTVGFIGFGRIARATLARLIPFGFRHVLYTTSASSTADLSSNSNSNSNSPSAPTASPTPSTPDRDRDRALAAQFPGVHTIRRAHTLAELARASDVLFVLAPGGPATHHIVDAAFLREMKRTAVLVNTSRGSLVDSRALAHALERGWLYGAGVDVVEGEPDVRADHPLVKAPRCIVLPHIASATTETRLAMATLAAENLLGGLFGKDMPAELSPSTRRR